MRSKSLDPELNEAARAYVRRVVAEKFAGNKRNAAAAFGISGSILGEFLSGTRGAGMKLLGGVAAYTGHSLDRIVGRTLTLVTDDGRSAWRNLAAWQQATVEARRDYGKRLPSVAFDHAGDFYGAAPPSVIDARTVYNAAKLWWESRDEDEQARAIALQAQAEMDAEDVEAEGLLSRGELHDELGAGTPPPKALPSASKKPKKQSPRP